MARQGSILDFRADSKSRWPQAVMVGAVFCLGVFLFLAWLQPVADGNRRIDLPEQFTYKFKLTQPKAPIQKPRRDEPKPRKERKRKPPKQTPKRQMKRTVTRQVRRTTSVAPARAQTSSFLPGGLNLGSSGTGGGPSISVPVGDASVGMAAEVLELASYQEQRKRVREAVAARDSANRLSSVAATDPQPQYLPEPDYPPAARRSQTEGYVQLRLLIGREGTVEDFQILDADPPGVFEEAIKAILPRWTFRPATDKKGRPIEASLDYYYVFKLEA